MLTFVTESYVTNLQITRNLQRRSYENFVKRTEATNHDILNLIRLNDMEEGGVAPLLVTGHNPTIRVTGDPIQNVCFDQKTWKRPEIT